MKKLILLLLFIPLLSFGQTLPKKISETEFSIGKSIKIESKILDEIRDLNIYLPLNYLLFNQKKAGKFPPQLIK